MRMNERIRARRKELGMSQETLAKKVGYEGRSAISKIESGEIAIKWDMIPAFAAALSMDPGELALWDEYIPPEDVEFVNSLGKISPKEELPEKLMALNVLVREIGWEIIHTNGEYYLGEIGRLTESDIKRLETAAVSALKVTYDMMVREKREEVFPPRKG